MAFSLRSLLWICFAVLTIVSLVVVAVGLVISLQTNPLLYRQVILRLNTAEAAVTQRIEDAPKILNRLPDKAIQKEAEVRQVRVLLLDSSAKVLLDVGLNNTTPLPAVSTPIKTTDANTQALTLRDANGDTWFYTMRPIEEGRYLMVTAPRPLLPLRSIFRDEILGPFLQAAGIAVLLAFVLTLILSQWISKPLNQIARSARAMANGQYQPISISGPREVQQLGEAFNEMAHRVQTSQQSQRDFVANVSHELKTPITSIQGFAQAIMDGTAQTPQTLQQSAGIIYSEASRMHRLVLDLLALARLDAGTADLQRQAVDIPALLKGIVEKFSPQAQQQHIQLVNLVTQLPTVIGDGDRLAQVFTNLVDNAIKHTPSEGTVTLNAGIYGADILVFFADTGEGIAPEDQKRIFERFYQVDKSRRGGEKRGTGLGLAIASQIVIAHQGQIWVESTPGRGATFCVRLPISASLPPSLPTPGA